MHDKQNKVLMQKKDLEDEQLIVFQIFFITNILKVSILYCLFVAFIKYYLINAFFGF